MAEFKVFKSAVQGNINSMTKRGAILYSTGVSGDVLWDSYLRAFPEGTNKMYKNRLEYDCTACKQFVRGIGNVVTLVDNKLVSIWRVDQQLPSPFNVVAQKLADLVESSVVADRYLSEFSKVGVDSNKQLLENGQVCAWEHFFCQLPPAYVSSSVPSDVAAHRDSKAVFQRTMEELDLAVCDTLQDLINQGENVVYRGAENLRSLKSIMDFKKAYDALPDALRVNWCWENSHNNPVAKLRNTAFGTLLTDLSTGVETSTAVFKFNNKMSPDKYKRPVSVFSKADAERAVKRIKDLGYENSLERRFAVADDVSVADVLFVDRSVRSRMVGGSVAADVLGSLIEEVSTVSSAEKAAEKATDISAEDFLANVVKGGATGIELLVEGRHVGNLMSLISPVHKEAPSMLKWDNNFGWAYNGDVADSMIKANVKSAGGKVDGVMRFSIQWNDGTQHNPNDFDAHCEEPNGNRIYFGVKKLVQRSSGMLDVDIQYPGPGEVAVENIVWSDKPKMPPGEYRMRVHNFSHNGGRTGFSAEIEVDGQLHQFSYGRELKPKQFIEVATVTLDKKTGAFTVKPLIDCTTSSKDVWGIKTQTFVPVSMMMLSPNHWDGQRGVGNKHYMFVLKGCKNDGSPRGFFNEFLKDELSADRKVFEALGSRMRVGASDDQLSGLGFSSTISNSVVARVTSGKSVRSYNIKF